MKLKHVLIFVFCLILFVLPVSAEPEEVETDIIYGSGHHDETSIRIESTIDCKSNQNTESIKVQPHIIYQDTDGDFPALEATEESYNCGENRFLGDTVDGSEIIDKPNDIDASYDEEVWFDYGHDSELNERVHTGVWEDSSEEEEEEVEEVEELEDCMGNLCESDVTYFDVLYIEMSGGTFSDEINDFHEMSMYDYSDNAQQPLTNGHRDLTHDIPNERSQWPGGVEYDNQIDNRQCSIFIHHDFFGVNTEGLFEFDPGVRITSDGGGIVDNEGNPKHYDDYTDMRSGQNHDKDNFESLKEDGLHNYENAQLGQYPDQLLNGELDNGDEAHFTNEVICHDRGGGGGNWVVCSEAAEEHSFTQHQSDGVTTADDENFKCEDGEWNEYEGDSCQAGHVLKTDDERYFAIFEGGDGECESEQYILWDYANTELNNGNLAYRTDSPNVFECEYVEGEDGEDDEVVVADDYSDDFSNSDCLEAEEWELGEHEINGEINDNEQWINAGSMPHVEYGPHRSYFEHLFENEAAGVDDSVSTKFVDPQSGWQTQTQGLLEAERQYSIGDRKLDPSWWENLNMTSVGIGNEISSNRYYNKTTAESHYQESGGTTYAWEPSNAGNHDRAFEETIISPENPSRRFGGGFAGICDRTDQTWTFDPEAVDDPLIPNWSCSGVLDQPGGGGGIPNGGVDPEPPIQLPELTSTAYLPEPATDGDNKEIGIVLFPFNNQVDGERPDYVPSSLSDRIPEYSALDETSDDGEIEGVRVACWSGRIGQEPDDLLESDYAFVESDLEVAGDEPVLVTNSVESREVGEDNTEVYSCRWNYEVNDFDETIDGSGHEAEDGPDPVIPLHKDENIHYVEQMNENGAGIPLSLNG